MGIGGRGHAWSSPPPACTGWNLVISVLCGRRGGGGAKGLTQSPAMTCDAPLADSRKCVKGAAPTNLRSLSTLSNTEIVHLSLALLTALREQRRCPFSVPCAAPPPPPVVSPVHVSLPLPCPSLRPPPQHAQALDLYAYDTKALGRDRDRDKGRRRRAGQGAGSQGRERDGRGGSSREGREGREQQGSF